jgi:hypothetical protein
MTFGLSLSILAALMLFAPIAVAWDGYDYDTGQYIEIEDEEGLIEGRDIEFYDHRDRKYHEGSIVSITRNGSIEVEIYDYDTKKYRTFVLDSPVPAKRQ